MNFYLLRLQPTHCKSFNFTLLSSGRFCLFYLFNLISPILAFVNKKTKQINVATCCKKVNIVNIIQAKHQKLDLKVGLYLSTASKLFTVQWGKQRSLVAP